MNAFYILGDTTIKAYDDMSGDWRVVTNKGHEYWFSQWQADRKASLVRAIAATCNYVKIDFFEGNIVFT